MFPRLKVCCISSVEEMRLAVRLGADAVGLVGAMPSGPGVIPDERIADIARAVPPPVMSVLLTSAQSADTIARQADAAGVSAVQIVDRVGPAVYARLRTDLPGRSLWQVVHVTGPEAIAEAERVARHVDAVLLDSGDPTLDTKALGGTGRVHDWRVSRTIRELLDIPVVLAGGLTPGNVADAVRAVGPFGLDVCSGLRTGGALDADKLAAFASAAGVQRLA
ncbi:N-(5'-phosphoribosyl)anthranilate isomerase [Rubrivirga marina]|uniref:N-(5'-phosphoribosyl)anthranilate isomerase n=1 Tax=Rubrivirga marina TaxID=1196024 RepID=A0A271J5Q9_9BACT|nr:N-(5'-phosphoribosyl)anthranilate isomerase [Rubrivirga marina]